MARRLTLAMLLGALACVSLASPAQARTRAFVAKPTNIVCVASRIGQSAATVRCDLPFSGRRAVLLHARGKARIKAVAAFLHPPHRSTLRRGAEARYGDFTCKSLKTAVSCRAGNGHGFTVGRKFQLTF